MSSLKAPSTLRTAALGLVLSILLLATAVFFAACGPGQRGVVDEEGRSVVEVWFHSGQAPERDTIRDQVARFNQMQDEIRIRLTLIPEGSYNAQVQSAALSGDLPDLLEFDGPFLYNYVWQGHLIPIGNLLPEILKRDLLPSIIEQGTYRGQLYSVGTFDSGLALYANRALLTAVGARIPKGIADAWTIDELDEILARLAEDSPGGAAIDLKLNYEGEWYCYAFSPILVSAGADLIDRSDFQRAGGTLDSDEAVAAMTRLQRWFADGWVDPNLDDAAFIDRRVALSWSGHWDYHRYAEHLGEDLLILPLPDFGEGSRTGQGSWNWGITRYAHDPRAAMKFLEFLLQPEEVLAMANANGAVPATFSAIQQSPLYRERGPLHLFVDQLEHSAVPRPATPAYPLITSLFEQAFQDIRHGADVRTVLQRMARQIDQDIEDNQGYQ